MKKDALSLLIEDHKEVRHAFEQYKKIPEKFYEKKKRFSNEICSELIKHASVEEEIFYPAVQETVEESEDMINESFSEHGIVKDLIDDIQSMSSDDEDFDRKILFLSEMVENHVQKEEEELFPLVRQSDLDLNDLGKRIMDLKEELEEEEM